MKNSVSGWFASHSRRQSRIAVRPRLVRMRLEALEARVVLSTFTVDSLLDVNPPSGVMTLRQAIAAANSDNNSDPQNPDIINVTVDGTITLASALPTIAGSVAIQGPGASSLTIAGDGKQDSILTIASTASVSVTGLTLDGAAGETAGLTVDQNAVLSLQSDVIQNFGTNTSGAGILNNGGTLTVSQSTFEGDIAFIYGGAIANLGGSLAVSESTFSGDYAEEGDGGGIYNMADSAGQGGVLTVVSSTFVDNSAAGYGGAIGLDLGSNATVVASTLTLNTSFLGGGAIDLHGRNSTGPQISLKLSSSTVVDNTSYGPGGGGVGGGGIYVRPSNVNLPTMLNDTIVADNSINDGKGGILPNDITGAVDSASSFNLIGDGSVMTGLAVDVHGNMIGTDASPINPRLGILQNSGGPTLTVAPLPGSPALDRGGPDPVGDGLISTDQRGDSRIVGEPDSILPLGGDGRDIGAFELSLQTPTILIVNSTADASPPSGVLTLREAIEAANGTLALSSLPAGQVEMGSPYIDEIDFSVTGKIALVSVLPTINAAANVALVGPGAANLMIVGDGLEDSILTVAPGASMSVAGLTIDGDVGPTGYGQNSGVTVGANALLGVQNTVIQNAVNNNEGGAVFNQAGIVTLSLSTFLDNNGVTFGGAVATLGGSLGVSQSVFTNNATEGEGGAIDVEGSLGGGAGVPAVLAIVDSTFAGNNSYGPNGGGGLYLAQNTVTSITNTTLAGNSALGAGGAILVFESTLNLLDSTVTGNSDESGAGGIFSNGDTATTLQNTIVAGNFLIGRPDSPSDVRGLVEPASAYNLIGDGDLVTGISDGANGNMVGTGASPIDARLGPLTNNGGPTPTVALLAESPAVDAGDPNFTAPPDFDQRGNGFPRVLDGRVDIGAYEFLPSSIGLGSDTVVANPGGPYSIRVGDALTLDGSGSSDSAGYALNYSWTIDGVANAATGVAPTLSDAQLQSLGISAGTARYTISVTVYDAFGTSATAATTLTVNMVVQSSPTLTWSVPADITYGTSLGTTQLDATASVPGAFSYSPPLGTILHGGQHQSLSVTFTPTDAVDYTTATATVFINVDRATPTIQWTNPADITYGTPITGLQLDALVSTFGTLSYSPPLGTLLHAGLDQPLSVTFSPSDAGDLMTVTATVFINVDRATPTLQWSNPADITFGTALGASQLDASSNVPGTFSYTPAAGTVLSVGHGQVLDVTFTPTDASDYTTATATTTINVATINVVPPAPTIIGEQALFQRKKVHGKPVGKPVLVGYMIDFSTKLSPSTAELASNYQVDTLSTKMVKKRKVSVLHPVSGFTVSYNDATASVDLLFTSQQKFKSGGQITVLGGPSSGVIGLPGAFVAGKRVLSISQDGNQITLI